VTLVKYYLVPVIEDPELGGKIPDTAATSWTARYLSDTVCLIRDPDGSQNYPTLLDSTPVGTLPLEVQPTMTPDEIDIVYVKWGIEPMSLWSMLDDRVGGV